MILTCNSAVASLMLSRFCYIFTDHIAWTLYLYIQTMDPLFYISTTDSLFIIILLHLYYYNCNTTDNNI